MRYVDGYVLPVPKKNLKAYRRMARKARRMWRKHGARLQGVRRRRPPVKWGYRSRG